MTNPTDMVVQRVEKLERELRVWRFVASFCMLGLIFFSVKPLNFADAAWAESDKKFDLLRADRLVVKRIAITDDAGNIRGLFGMSKEGPHVSLTLFGKRPKPIIEMIAFESGASNVAVMSATAKSSISFGMTERAAPMFRIEGPNETSLALGVHEAGAAFISADHVDESATLGWNENVGAHLHIKKGEHGILANAKTDYMAVGLKKGNVGAVLGIDEAQPKPMLVLTNGKFVNAWSAEGNAVTEVNSAK